MKLSVNVFNKRGFRIGVVHIFKGSVLYLLHVFPMFLVRFSYDFQWNFQSGRLIKIVVILRPFFD